MNEELRYRYQLSGGTNATKLWRYLTFEKFTSLLDSQKLWHSRLDQMEDPFEGSVTEAYAKLRDEGGKNGYMDTPEHEPINNKRLRMLSYVTCWHSSSHESMAMWKLYCKENAGVAVVSTAQRMAGAVILPDETKHGLLSPVEYFDFTNDDMMIRPFGRIPQIGFAKRKSFEHESEVRGLIRHSHSPQNIEQQFSEAYVESLKDILPVGLEAQVDLPALIEAIYVSPLAGSWFYKIVQTASDRAGLKQRVRKSDLGGSPVY